MGFIALRSAKTGDKWSRYSIIGEFPIRAWQGRLEEDSQAESRLLEAFGVMDSYFLRTANFGERLGAAALSQGGIMGYLSYELYRWIESVPLRRVDDIGLPHFWWAEYPAWWVKDEESGEVWFDGKLMSKLPEEINKWLYTTHPLPPANKLPSPQSNLSYRDYYKMIERAREYIYAGDIYQVNLCQRLMFDIGRLDWAEFYRISQHNPTPFYAYIDLGQVRILSCSPELFLYRQGNRILTRPIKGTAAWRQGVGFLPASAKDRAEHIMIVDLERNDLGRICEYGGVRVSQMMVQERYKHLYHLVSTIEGQLRKEVSWWETVRATFPGGSVTGAPKIRAMEIIDELELNVRSVYCGALGFVARNGEALWCLPIRTVVEKGGKGFLWVGGGIVADSDPHQEWQETWLKGQAILEGLGVGRDKEGLS